MGARKKEKYEIQGKRIAVLGFVSDPRKHGFFLLPKGWHTVNLRRKVEGGFFPLCAYMFVFTNDPCGLKAALPLAGGREPGQSKCGLETASE